MNPKEEWHGGKGAAVIEKSETMESLTQVLAKQVSDLASKATFIADKIGGTRPEVAQAHDPEPDFNSVMSRLRDIQRQVYRLNEQLSRAEGYICG